MKQKEQIEPDSFDYKEYARKMRMALCDKQIIINNGEINHKYFLVKKGQYWTQDMQKSLIEELELNGVGNWKSMQKGELKNISEIELELRTCLILGISEINQYIGEKITRKQIENIHKGNIKRGQELCKLKYGIYIV